MKKGVMRMAAAFMLLFVLVVSCSAQSAAETEPAAAGQAAGDTAAAGSAAIAGSAAVSGTSDLPEPTDLVARFSYALGYLQTQSYVSQGIEFDVDYYAAAMAAAIEGSEPMFTPEEMNAILMEYQEVLIAREEEYLAEAAGVNLAIAEDFLAENGARAEVVTTESGLQYEILSEGAGEQPGLEDVVTVHYSGTLIDGTVFDSSYQRGTPATFPLNGVIPGWSEGVQLMQVGSSFRFFIHPDLAYGTNGAGEFIGPNELLIFDVELLEIEAE
jgi:FKBP-type peptidyl-prolyl cis-trans isomerase